MRFVYLKPLLSLSLLFVVSLTNPAFAQEADSANRAAARRLGQQGVEAYQAENYAEASDRLNRAFEVLQVPTLGLWSARAFEKQGKLVEAYERYMETARLSPDAEGDPEVQARAIATAKKEGEALQERIPILVVSIEGADPDEVSVTIDDVPVSRALFDAGRPTNPGRATVVAVLGEQRVEQEIELAEGEEKTVTFELEGDAGSSATPLKTGEADPAQADKGSSWQPITGWTAIGLGTAGLALGGVMGVVAMDKQSQLESAGCVEGSCPLGTGSLIGEYDSAKTMSSVGFIAGGVLAAAGVTLLLTTPKQDNSAYVSPYLGFASAGVRGTF